MKLDINKKTFIGKYITHRTDGKLGIELFDPKIGYDDFMNNNNIEKDNINSMGYFLKCGIHILPTRAPEDISGVNNIMRDTNLIREHIEAEH